MTTTQPQARLFRVKEGKLDQWLAWCQRLNGELRDEAAATLKDEGIRDEFFITFEIDRVHYTLGAVLTPNGETPKPADSSVAINAEHKRLKRECLELVGKGDFSYFIEA